LGFFAIKRDVTIGDDPPARAISYQAFQPAPEMALVFQWFLKIPSHRAVQIQTLQPPQLIKCDSYVHEEHAPSGSVVLRTLEIHHLHNRALSTVEIEIALFEMRRLEHGCRPRGNQLNNDLARIHTLSSGPCPYR